MRFFVSGTTTSAFSGNAFNFAVSPAGGTDLSLQVPPSPKVNPGDEVASGASPSAPVTSPMGGQRDIAPAAQASPVTTQAASSIRIFNDGGADIEFSFDGTNIHGIAKTGGPPMEYRNRFETGIALRGAGGASVAFRVEAW